MPSNDLIPDFAPPAGGLAKLMRRIDRAEAGRRGTVRRNTLFGGVLVGGLAAAIALIMLPHASPTLSDLVARSDALHLYKYGLKAMPTEGLRLQDPKGAVTLRQTDYGFARD